jgi:hypothetical protein
VGGFVAGDSQAAAGGVRGEEKMSNLKNIPEDERTPLVVELLEIINGLQEEVQRLRDEIARLKGQKPKPDIKPSQMEKASKDKKRRKKKKGKRPGSDKRKKTQALEIHQERIVSPDNVPAGSVFKGYQEFTVQDLVIMPFNTLYLLERWQTPDGEYVTAKLPADVIDHFGLSLHGFVLYQYYHACVTQPLILEMLHEIGIDISAGKVNQIISEGKERFESEKDEILRAGLEVSRHINVDDTSARHQGKNGFCTHIGNELFAWFKSADSKSRINFLELLRAGASGYAINKDALDYMETQKLPKGLLEKFASQLGRCFENDEAWQDNLKALNIQTERHVRIATEGALMGSVIENGFNKDTVIISDDAGQFNIFLHGLCWIHAERLLAKLVGFDENQRKALDKKRGEVWDLYDQLKRYKQSPDERKKKKIEARFDKIFTEKTCFQTLNLTLKRIHQNKPELLLVLDRPDIPLHNNESERDIREYVKRRKISGSTRSDEGRSSRDTMISLKKTCRKLKVSFWEYLIDRLSGLYLIPPLPDLIRLKAQEAKP